MCHLSGLAQIITTIQTIEATDGYIYKGWLIDQVDDLIRFENIEGDTLSFYQDEIIQYIHPDDYFLYKKDKYHPKKGSFSMIDMGLGGFADEFTLQFTYAYGRRITPQFLLGLGTGFNFSGELDLLAGQEFFGELYIYTKYYITNTKIRPFIDSKIGAFSGIDQSVRDDLYPGVILQGGVGFEFAQQTETRFSIRFNYLFMYALAKTISPSNILDDLKLKRPLMGITFNF